MTLAAACLVGFAVAWAAGADPRQLATLRLRWTLLIAAALALQLAIYAAHASLPGPFASNRLTHLVSYLLLVTFAARNARLPGFALAAAGLLSNATVIFLNGGRMPVAQHAWVESTTMNVARHHGVYNNTAVAGAGTHLAFLGDIFAVPRSLPLANTFSIGDVLLVMGATLFVYRSGRSKRDRPVTNAFTPLRDHGFRTLLAGRTVSKLGDWISIAALITWVYARTHSTTAVSVLLLARITASITGGLIGGSVLGRSRFRTLATVEAGRALFTLLALAAVATGHSYAVAGCVFASSFLSAATDPTASSLVADILAPESRHAGNALHAVARAAVMATGSIAGGIATTKIGAVPALAVDTATFAIAFGLYWRSGRNLEPRRTLPSRETPQTETDRGRLDALTGIARSRPLAGLVVSFALATLAMGLLSASLPAFLAGHAPAAGGYGVAMGMIGLGLMCGEFLSGRLPERIVGRAPALGFALSAAVLAVTAASHLATTILLLLFLLGLSDGTTETAYDTLVQDLTPRTLRARVFSLAGAIQQMGMVVGILLAPLVQHTRPGTALHSSSIALGGAALIAALSITLPTRRAFRKARRPAAGGVVHEH